MTENQPQACCKYCGERLVYHLCPSDVKEMSKRRLAYTIALERAIEAHCRGQLIEIDGSPCIRHAAMLNDVLKRTDLYQKQLAITAALKSAILAHCRGEMIERATDSPHDGYARLLNECLGQKGPTNDPRQP